MYGGFGLRGRVRQGSRESGQTVLPLVFLMGGLIVLMSLTLIFLAHSFLVSSYGFQISERAKAVAASGAYDALMRLARNKDLSGSYSLPIGDYSAGVTIAQNSPVSGRVTVNSASTIASRQRKVTAIASRSTETGQIVLISWRYTQ